MVKWHKPLVGWFRHPRLMTRTGVGPGMWAGGPRCGFFKLEYNCFTVLCFCCTTKWTAIYIYIYILFQFLWYYQLEADTSEYKPSKSAFHIELAFLEQCILWLLTEEGDGENRKRMQVKDWIRDEAGHRRCCPDLLQGALGALTCKKANVIRHWLNDSRGAGHRSA